MQLKEHILQGLQVPHALGRFKLPFLVFGFCKLLPDQLYAITVLICSSPKVQSLQNQFGWQFSKKYTFLCDIWGMTRLWQLITS